MQWDFVEYALSLRFCTLALAAFVSVAFTLGAYLLIHAHTAPGPIFSAVMGTIFVILASMMIRPGVYLISGIKGWRKPRAARRHLIRREFNRLCTQNKTASPA